MEPLMKRVFMFAIIPAIIVGPGLVGLNSVVAQNMTPGGMMAGNMTPGGMMAGSAKMHLEEGIKALEAGNIQMANLHLDFAKQAMANAPTNAVKHFEEGMKTLGVGDSTGALMHLKLADQALG
ncbi:MAG TPA: hypothetical protein VD710_02765 [Nitrososphaeraceae archaeon]|nr:hypothetical protein [Nitrososphaeraceae archaeon]